MRGFDADVLVVGSGFGGSVAALRAAEAGRSVLVCEQGRRLSPDDLQRGAERTRSLLWAPSAGLRGYFQQTLLRHVTIVSGVGVGGGSIVYAAVLLEPSADVFHRTGWRRTGVAWAPELAPHFAVSGRMLGRQRNPQRGVQDEWLRTAATDLGVPDTFGPTYQGINFDACVACGQCITGCPYGAKQSLDVTYLAAAERAGARILTQAKAEILVPLGGADGSDGWKVVLRDPLHGRRVSSVTACAVVLAAGVLGTTELLLACRDRWGTLPRLSDQLGRHVRTNSEAFAAVLHPPGTDVTRGATISSDFYPDPATHVTNNRFPRSYSFMKWYLSPAVGGADLRERRRRTVRRMLRQPAEAAANMLARDWHRRVTVLTVMQDADNELELRYRKRLGSWGLRSALAPGAEPVPVHLPQADAAGRAVADASGGTPYSTLLESVAGMGATAHILGGAVLSDSPATGVVDPDHRVFGYDGLRVLDGSAVPENIGVNPSWTITALAERAMARWLGCPSTGSGTEG